MDVPLRVRALQDGGVGGDGSGLGRRNQNEKHQDKKGKAICKYYIEGRCTWVRHHKCVHENKFCRKTHDSERNKQKVPQYGKYQENQQMQ